MADRDPVLVIKHGALGDFILACGPFAAIRAHHPRAPITLLTTAPYAALAEATGWFDAVWLDPKPGWHELLGLLRLRRRFRAGGFARVYDLQTSDRSSLYFRFWPRAARPEWSGIAAGCSHPHANPERDRMHTVDRQAEQLRIAGITEIPPISLAWLDGEISAFALTPPFALLVPGGAAHRPEKRWPDQHYGGLAKALLAREITPVLIGTAAEAASLERIAARAPGTVNLVDRTSFGQIAALARRAALAVGNDTGPMHIVAAAGCRTLVLFSHRSDPALCAQTGPAVRIIRRAELDQLSSDQVVRSLTESGWL